MAAASPTYVYDDRGGTVQRVSDGAVSGISHVQEAFGNPRYSLLPTDGRDLDPFDGFGAQWGYYQDAETGLVLATNRYYDPGTGRWLTRDPIGYDGGINLYGYVQGNPVMGVGLWTGARC